MNCYFYDAADQEDLEIFMEVMYESRGMVFDPEGLHYDLRHIDEVYLPGGHFWLLKEDSNKVTGSIGLKILDVDNRVGEIKRFFLLPEHQGNGYGKLLMRTAIDYARGLELRKVRLDTMRRAEQAQAIFQKFGFHEIAKYNNNDAADLFFELVLE